MSVLKHDEINNLISLFRDCREIHEYGQILRVLKCDGSDNEKILKVLKRILEHAKNIKDLDLSIEALDN